MVAFVLASGNATNERIEYMKPDDYEEYEEYRYSYDFTPDYMKTLLEELIRLSEYQTAPVKPPVQTAPKREPTEPVVTKESAAELSRWFAL